MYGGMGKEATHARFCRRGNRLDVGRHGQLLAVEAVFRPIRVDVAEAREVAALLELGRVGLLEALRVPVVSAFFDVRNALPDCLVAGTAVDPSSAILEILARTRILFAEL